MRRPGTVMGKAAMVVGEPDERQSPYGLQARLIVLVQCAPPMLHTPRSIPRRAIAVSSILILVLAASARTAAAQEPAPIPRFVVDLHGLTNRFPDDPQLAASRGLAQEELPGRGFGGDIAVHVFPFRYRAVTFGLGGRLTSMSASRNQDSQTLGLRPVTERFTYLGPQLSFNFGNESGWSYLSGGISVSRWSVAVDGPPLAGPDVERLKTLDYGGGARWFAKRHLAFSFDIRFYAINPSTPVNGLPPSPRSRLFVIGAGVSIK
jgi:hypothetical protein